MITIKFRRGTAASWTTANPILRPGEPGHETDTGRYKIGDGFTRWLDLPAFLNEEAVRAMLSGVGTGGEPPSNLLEHALHPTPHVAYDEGPSFALLYENAKV